jgi:hypothetical protein
MHSSVVITIRRDSCKTLSRIAENLVREPENPKFRQFKPTNDMIKRRLVETKGALEYAIAVRLTEIIFAYLTFRG